MRRIELCATEAATMPATSPTYRLSDDPGARPHDLLPLNGRRGGQWKDHRLMIAGILRALSDGGRWRNLPADFGPWQSVYDRFRSRARRGLWDRLLRRLQARKMTAGEIDFSLFCIDGTAVRAPRSAAGASEETGRRARPRTTPSAAPGAGSRPGGA